MTKKVGIILESGKSVFSDYIPGDQVYVKPEATTGLVTKVAWNVFTHEFWYEVTPQFGEPFKTYFLSSQLEEPK